MPYSIIIVFTALFERTTWCQFKNSFLLTSVTLCHKQLELLIILQTTTTTKTTNEFLTSEALWPASWREVIHCLFYCVDWSYLLLLQSIVANKHRKSTTNFLLAGQQSLLWFWFWLCTTSLMTARPYWSHASSCSAQLLLSNHHMLLRLDASFLPSCNLHVFSSWKSRKITMEFLSQLSSSHFDVSDVTPGSLPAACGSATYSNWASDVALCSSAFSST